MVLWSRLVVINEDSTKVSMMDAKVVKSTFAAHFKLLSGQAPETEEERIKMSNFPYASFIGKLTYAMVCSRPDLAHSVSVVSRFIGKPGKARPQESSKLSVISKAPSVYEKGS